ncbi:hypothetical protein FOA52_005855 [Chlamydomonas sp. UWO 241]|nr:hypothetical protein FOA52_005855 [Chlamydomonas sp. UWO 241]
MTRASRLVFLGLICWLAAKAGSQGLPPPKGGLGGPGSLGVPKSMILPCPLGPSPCKASAGYQYMCTSGAAVAKCRAFEKGPFPTVDCSKQCTNLPSGGPAIPPCADPTDACRLASTSEAFYHCLSGGAAGACQALEEGPLADCGSHCISVGSMPPEPETFLTVASSIPEISIFARALALLFPASNDPDLKATMFIPNDAAFYAAEERLGMSVEELLANTPLLTQIVAYHIYNGGVLYSSMAPTTPGANITMLLTDPPASVHAENINEHAGVFMNDALSVRLDISVNDYYGVIQIIDKVLLPPSALAMLDGG